MTNGTKFFHLVCLLAVMLTMAQPHSLTYAQAPVKPTTIKGVVVDSLTREPIPFAMVLLQGSSAGTQADARRVLEGEPNDTYKRKRKRHRQAADAAAVSAGFLLDRENHIRPCVRLHPYRRQKHEQI